MAKAGQSIENPVTGQRIVFLTSAHENGGTHWEVEWFVQPDQGKFPPEHWHPAFSERFEILAGQVRYRLNGQEQPAHPGDVVSNPAGRPHLNPWNAGDQELHMRQVFELDPPNLPLLSRAEDFFESLFVLAQDGKVGRDGMPNLLQFSVMAVAASPLAYPAGMSRGVADSLFGALAWLGGLLGYQARYPPTAGGA